MVEENDDGYAAYWYFGQNDTQIHLVEALSDEDAMERLKYLDCDTTYHGCPERAGMGWFDGSQLYSRELNKQQYEVHIHWDNGREETLCMLYNHKPGAIRFADLV